MVPWHWPEGGLTVILEALLTVFTGLIRMVIRLFPTTPAPSWLADGDGLLQTIWSYGSGLGAWVPWTTVAQVFAAVISCLVAALSIRLVRIVASFLTGGGGSAA